MDSIPVSSRAVEELAAIPAGPDLAAALAAIEVHDLDAFRRVDVLIAHRRLVAHYEAKAYADMAAIETHFRNEDGSEEIAFDGTAAELRAALYLTRRAAEGELHFAKTLWQRLPRVGMALMRGDIDRCRARVLADGTWHLPLHTARAVVRDLLGEAAELTTGQLRARLSRACIETDPAAAKDRYEQAVDRRRAVSYLTEAGTANLSIYDAEPDQVAASARFINALALQLKRGGDARSIDQLRADVAMELLQGTLTADDVKAAKPLGGVHIATDLETLVHLADHPGELAGYGPVIADIARRTVEQQRGVTWEFSVTDSRTGEIVATGTTRRRPNAGQGRLVRAQYPTCIFPGCRMPAVDCDIDHRIPWIACRRTRSADLGPYCRHDHVLRHTHGWSYRILCDGLIEFTSGLGRKYLRKARSP